MCEVMEQLRDELIERSIDQGGEYKNHNGRAYIYCSTGDGSP